MQEPVTLHKCAVIIFLVFSAALACAEAVGMPEVAAKRWASSGVDEQSAGARSRKVALVIGNANYPSDPLKNPLQDARRMDRLLGRMGFAVSRLENGTRNDMQIAIKRFVAKLTDDGTALFYFSGHGSELGDMSLMLPVDADLRAVGDSALSGINVRPLVAALSASRGRRQNLVILDSCRTRWDLPEAGPRTAHSVTPPEGMLIAYATRAGGSADDGIGRTGIYTAALVREMAGPRRQAIDLFARVGTAVSARTAQRQIPEFISALTRPVFLGQQDERMTEGDLPAMTFASAGLAERSRGIIPESGEARYELLFWDSIKNSDQAADYEAYLEAFPNGRFAPLAKARASHLRNKAKAAGAPDSPASEITPAAKDEGLRVEPMQEDYTAVVTANVRERPAADAARIAVVEKDSRVRVTGRLADRNWYQVTTAEGKKGYVYGTLIQPAAAPRAGMPAPAAPSAPSAAAPPGLASAPRGEPPETFKDCPDCPEMVVVAPGSFTMGAAKGDPSERPAHSVTIRQPFAIGKYEVTVGQWQACVTGGGCSYRAEEAGSKADLPVRDVSWDDAEQYVKWLSSLTGDPYRLPTEAEWEYAARAGSQSRYWWGGSMEEGKAHCKGCGGQWDGSEPATVGSYPANPFGLYDMNGNVWEWVSDCWHPSYKGAPSDQRSWEGQDCRQRVIRGGSWRNDATYAYSTSRFYYDADVRYGLHGFRVAKSLR